MDRAKPDAAQKETNAQRATVELNGGAHRRNDGEDGGAKRSQASDSFAGVSLLRAIPDSTE